MFHGTVQNSINYGVSFKSIAIRNDAVCKYYIMLLQMLRDLVQFAQFKKCENTQCYFSRSVILVKFQAKSNTPAQLYKWYQITQSVTNIFSRMIVAHLTWTGFFFREWSSHNKKVQPHQRSSHAHGQTTIINSRG